MLKDPSERGTAAIFILKPYTHLSLSSFVDWPVLASPHQAVWLYNFKYS